VAPGQQPPSEPQGHGQYPQRDPTPRIPSGSKPAPLQTGSPPPKQYPPQQQQSGHRPQSTYSNPQELATSVYDSPVNQHNPNPTYSASVYSQEDPYSAGHAANQQPPPGQQQYNAYAPPQQHQPPTQQQPGYEPSAPPSNNIPPPVAMNAGYPVIGNPHDARQTLPSQGGSAQPQYKAYQPPGESHNPSAPSAPTGGPADFYRQSTAYWVP